MEWENIENFKDEILRLREAIGRKEREMEIMRVNNLFLANLFDGINEEIMVVDEDFVVQDVNRAFLEGYCLRKEDVLGKKCHEIRTVSGKLCRYGMNPCPMEKALETGDRVEVTHYYDIEDGKKEMIRIMYPLEIQGGSSMYFVEISRDVTEYRALIRKLQASEKNLRNVLNTAKDAILSIDENQKVTLFNNAAERIFGYERSLIIGKSLSTLIPQQYGDHYSIFRKFVNARETEVMGEVLSLIALRKSGEQFPIELGLSCHDLEGNITFTAVIRDVSNQRQLEKKLLQSERLAAVGSAAARVAHEIKTPLMIIGGFSYQLRRGLSDEKDIQKFDMILEEVSRLEKLVANLADFTKEFKLVKRRTDINSVINDVLKIMAEMRSGEKYHFKAELDADLKEIYCDPDKLKQVFMNLLINGIEAMSEGGSITIQSRNWPDGVELLITDEGAGIDENDLDHIFEPFYTTREGGSGLGLAISYKIIEAHLGEIYAMSAPGQGTTFILRIPGG
jgi:two-component system sensor kinase FixL